MRLAVAAACLAFLAPVRAHASGCSSNFDCKGGRVCASGACVDVPSSCGKDTDCPGDMVCTDQKCAAPSAQPSRAPAPPSNPPTAPEPKHPRTRAACIDRCAAERNECDEGADAALLNCNSAAKTDADQRSCTVQSQDRHGQCADEVTTCTAACH